LAPRGILGFFQKQDQQNPLKEVAEK
jgi:hypothetical protein